MAIGRAAVLTGHVLASLVQHLLSGAVVLAVAIALGFRPPPTPADWLAAIGVLALFTLALTWLRSRFGLAAKSAGRREQHSLMLSCCRSSAAASSRPTRCPPACAGSPSTSPSRRSPRPCAGCSPAPRSAHDAILAIAWCVGIALACYLWARARYERVPVR